MDLLVINLLLCIASSIVMGEMNFDKDVQFSHGSIIEKENDVFLVSSNVVVEVDLLGIFLEEADVINLKSDISNFAILLKELHQRHFASETKTTLTQAFKIAKLLSFELLNKTSELESLARDLLMWTIPRSNFEKRNPFLFAALNVIGSVASLGMSLTNRLKINAQNKRLRNIEHTNTLIISELHNQMQAINDLINTVNDMSSTFNVIVEIQDLLLTLTYYNTKLDHIRTNINLFIERSKDYVEAITLATKGVLSPHLLPIKDLMQIIDNGRRKMGYIPLLDSHSVEFYYSLITVSVQNFKIMITIPFDSSNAWLAFSVNPFPSYMINSTTPVINDCTGHVLISPDKEMYTVVRDQNTWSHCLESLNSRMCPIHLFEFRHYDQNSCELALVLNGSLSLSREDCLANLHTFDKDKFSYRMGNGSVVRFAATGFDVVCPDGTSANSKIYIAEDGCNGTTDNYHVQGTTTITRRRTLFTNLTWTTSVPVKSLPYNRMVSAKIAELVRPTIVSSTYERDTLAYSMMAAVTGVLALLLVAILIYTRTRFGMIQQELQTSVGQRPFVTPTGIPTFRFRAIECDQLYMVQSWRVGRVAGLKCG